MHINLEHPVHWLSALATLTYNCIAGDKYSFCKGPFSNLCIPMAVATGSGKGGGLLEKPVIEKSTPGRESEFDLRYVKLLICRDLQNLFYCSFLLITILGFPITKGEEL